MRLKKLLDYYVPVLNYSSLLVEDPTGDDELMIVPSSLDTERSGWKSELNPLVVAYGECGEKKVVDYYNDVKHEHPGPRPVYRPVNS